MDDTGMLDGDPFSDMLQFAERTMMTNFIFQIVMIILAVVAIIGIVCGLILLRQFLAVYKANSEHVYKQKKDKLD